MDLPYTKARQKPSYSYYVGSYSMAPQSQYCALHVNHTACKYTSIDETRCATTGRIRGMSADEKDAIVKAHNDKRRIVAKGLEPNQPPAANMIKMVRLFPEFDLSK